MTLFRALIALVTISLFIYASLGGLGGPTSIETHQRVPDASRTSTSDLVSRKDIPAPKCPECEKCDPVKECTEPKECPKPKESNESAQRHLVITSEANHFDRAVISTFLFSLRDTGSTAEVLLFTTDPEDRELHVLAHEFAPVTLANWTVKEGEDLVIVRFGFYLSWFEKAKKTHTYDLIFVSDLDVVFFKDPFKIALPLPSGLALFAENRTLTIGMCEAHRYWINECGGKLGDLWKLMATESRICAGTVLGTVDAIATLLDKQVAILNSTRCNDQLTLQYLHYSKNLAPATVYATETGPGATLGTQLFWNIDRWGRVLNTKGEVVTFAHQFRYHEGINEVVSRRWPYLPRGDVREEAASPVPKFQPTNESSETAHKVVNSVSGGAEVWRTCNWAKVTDCPRGVVNVDGSHDPKPDIVAGWKKNGIEYPHPKEKAWAGTGNEENWKDGFGWLTTRWKNATKARGVAQRIALDSVPIPTVKVNNDNPAPIRGAKKEKEGRGAKKPGAEVETEDADDSKEANEPENADDEELEPTDSGQNANEDEPTESDEDESNPAG